MTSISGTAQLRPVVPKSTYADFVEGNDHPSSQQLLSLKLEVAPRLLSIYAFFRRELASSLSCTSDIDRW